MNTATKQRGLIVVMFIIGALAGLEVGKKLYYSPPSPPTVRRSDDPDVYLPQYCQGAFPSCPQRCQCVVEGCNIRGDSKITAWCSK